MEIQAQSSPGGDPQPSGEPDQPAAALLTWDQLLDLLPLGFFIISGAGQKVNFNASLADLLESPPAHALDEEQFWNGLGALGADRTSARREIKLARERLKGTGSADFGFQTRKGEHLEIRLFALSGSPIRGGGYGGFLRDDSQQTEKHSREVEILAEICGSTRIAAAGAAGNLEALGKNLRSWSPEMVGGFLANTADQIRTVQDSLDLALSYAALIQKLPVYRKPVKVGELLSDLTGGSDRVAVRTLEGSLGSDPLPPIEVDLALSKLAVETLLDELLRHNPPGLQVEGVLEEMEDFLVLKFISPRTLPLPGLDRGRDQDPELPIKLLLARELLSAQGVRIAIQERPLPEGGGADLEIYFPLAESIQRSQAELAGGSRLESLEGRILVAESQPDYQVRLREELAAQGYRVDLAGDGSTALDMVQTLNPDLVILARNLPGMDGLLVTQGIRRWSAVPIIMISSHSGTDDQLYAYRLGVDDYLHKPILIEELLAKVRVFLIRQQDLYQAGLPEIYQAGSIRIDHTLHQVWVRGARVELTPIEYNLLLYLSRRGRQIVTYEQLMESVWEGPEKGTRQGLFVHVRRLRKKIELDPENPQIIKNKWGVGYVFNP